MPRRSPTCNMRFSLCVFALALFPGFLTALEVGLRKQLFVDDYIISRITNVTRESGAFHYYFERRVMISSTS